MNSRQILANKTLINEDHGLLGQLAENCYMDLLTGEFHCRKCHNVVHIDLSRKYAFCPVHGMLINFAMM